MTQDRSCLLIQASLLFALIAAATAAQPRELQMDFKTLCKTLGPYAPMRDQGKVIKTESFCSSSGLDSNPMKCALLNTVEAALIKMYDSAGSTTCEVRQTAVNDKDPSTGAALPIPLSERRPLPSDLSNKNLWNTEGSSIYWIWKNLFNFNKWACSKATDKPQTVTPGTPGGWLVPAGWTVHSTLWQPSGIAGSSAYWPFATVIYKGSEVAILIRGSQTEQDWTTDFNYNTDSTTLQPGNIKFPGYVHQGFASVTATLWGGIAAALNDVISTSGKISNVYVGGHSLGAGVATLVSYATQEYLTQQGQKTAKVDALLFAPPNAGDSVFADSFGKTVNARRMPFKFDVVPQVPCTPTMVGCKRASVPTGDRKFWSYSSVPGKMEIQPSEMPQQAEAWGLFDKIFPCQIGNFFMATHVCSYDCFLSQWGGDSNNSCKLWEDNSGKGTACGKFPIKDAGGQYPYKGKGL